MYGPNEFSKEIFETHLDRFNMVTPQLGWQDSGNGILYSAVFLALYVFFGGKITNEQREWFKKLILSCYKEEGNVMRTPINSYGQEQWDNLLGIAVGCILIGETKIPREILAYGVKHLFIFNTDDKLEGKDFLGRFPQVWVLMAAAGFPLLKLLAYPVAALIGKAFMDPPDHRDSSGVQLQWMFHYGSVAAFGKLLYRSIYNNWVQKLSVSKNDGFKSVQEAFLDYYDSRHGFNKILATTTSVEIQS